MDVWLIWFDHRPCVAGWSRCLTYHRHRSECSVCRGHCHRGLSPLLGLPGSCLSSLPFTVTAKRSGCSPPPQPPPPPPPPVRRHIVPGPQSSAVFFGVVCING